MINKPKFDLDFWFFIVLSLFMALSFVHYGFTQEVRTLKLDDKSIAKIQISPKGTVLSFPTKPTKVILGNKGAFGIEYVEADLAISPLTNRAAANLFVYLEGRRFAFDLSVSEAGGDDIILVRDSLENQIQVRIK